MRFLRLVGVDETLVDELWDKVSTVGGFYSIGDGVTKDTFRKMLFRSAAVLQGKDLAIRLDNGAEALELHPIVFGPETFRNARAILDDVVELSGKLFNGKPVCCIIPREMRGARHLALKAGMMKSGELVRPLSGVMVSCDVFRR